MTGYEDETQKEGEAKRDESWEQTWVDRWLEGKWIQTTRRSFGSSWRSVMMNANNHEEDVC